MYSITCKCGETGDEQHFSMSLSDECSCPKCGAQFTIEWDDDEDSDDDGLDDEYPKPQEPTR